MHSGGEDRPPVHPAPAVVPIFDAVPQPQWGAAMRCLEEPDGQLLISAEAPGLLKSPPALKLMAAGVPFIAVGLFVIGGAAFVGLRYFEPVGSVFAFAIGGMVGGVILGTGVMQLRWAAAAAWGLTEIVLSRKALHVRRTGRRIQQVEVLRADFCGTQVADQMGMADELLVMAEGPRSVRVLSGRSRAELRWLAALIESQLGPPRSPRKGQEEPEGGEGGSDETWDDGE